MMQKRNHLWLAVLGVAAILALAGWYWLGRPHEAAEARAEADAAQASVPVARVRRGDVSDTLKIAGAFKPFQDVEVHAKVAGYIRNIYVDVGSHVKEGQVLAVLEVPELAAQLSAAEAACRAAQQQIQRAQGDLERARSTHSAAHSAYTRLKQAADSRAGLVAQQEVDDSQAKDLEAEGQVSAAEASLAAARQQFEVAQANEKQANAMSAYTRIVAPFDGVVTVRSADTGTLVAAGTSESTQAIPVVRLAQYSVLRLVLPIPESVSSQIRVGQAITVHVPALNQDITGKVSRFADALNEQTRTMETEVDFQNADNHLLPGMYAEATITYNQQHNVLTIPLEAVQHEGNDSGSGNGNGKSAEVLVLNAQNEVERRKVTLGHEGDSRVVVLSGLAEGERVILGARGNVRPGQKVVPKEIGDASAAGARGLNRERADA
jgi:RND family efflux transporter MFP subunit